jgi:hypothetical protein
MSVMNRVHNYLTLLPSTIVYRTLLMWLVYFSIGKREDAGGGCSIQYTYYSARFTVYVAYNVAKFF